MENNKTKKILYVALWVTLAFILLDFATLAINVWDDVLSYIKTDECLPEQQKYLRDAFEEMAGDSLLLGFLFGSICCLKQGTVFSPKMAKYLVSVSCSVFSVETIFTITRVWAYSEWIDALHYISSKLAFPAFFVCVALLYLKTGKAKAVRFSTLEAICQALDCQPGDILEYEEDIL